jgi:hypothetical protein
MTPERAVSQLALKQTADQWPGGNGGIGLHTLPQKIPPRQIADGWLRCADEPLHRRVAADPAARRSGRYSARRESGMVAVSH